MIQLGHRSCRGGGDTDPPEPPGHLGGRERPCTSPAVHDNGGLGQARGPRRVDVEEAICGEVGEVGVGHRPEGRARGGDEGSPDSPSMPLPGGEARGAVQASMSMESSGWLSGSTLSGPRSPVQKVTRLFPSCPLTSATAAAHRHHEASHGHQPARHTPARGPVPLPPTGLAPHQVPGASALWTAPSVLVLRLGISLHRIWLRCSGWA